MRKQYFISIIFIVIVIASVLFVNVYENAINPNETISENDLSENPTLKVGIAPYQDMAMLKNIYPLNLEEKYGLDIELFSMDWENLSASVASASTATDVAFASLLQFIVQEHNLNADSDDPVVFFFPAYVFKGGAFVTFNLSVPAITADDLSNQELVKDFLSFSFAYENSSSYQQLIALLAEKNSLDEESINHTPMGAESGLNAAKSGAVDITSAGLTQKNEAVKSGGRVVLEMTDLGQVDIAGFIARRSTIEKNATELGKFIQMWTETIDFTFRDIRVNSKAPLAYLSDTSSTEYTYEEYISALESEILPKTVEEIYNLTVPAGSDFEISRIVEDYYLFNKKRGVLDTPPRNIKISTLEELGF